MASSRPFFFIAALGSVFTGGCFALFSLDDYGPNRGVDADAATDAPPTDGGSADANDSAPPPARIVFVTSGRFNGSLGGLAGADNRCNAAAQDAGLKGAFTAWLGQDGMTAASRVGQPTRAMVLVTGKPVADDLANLAATGPKTPILVTEKKEQLDAAACDSDRVWTNAKADGTLPDLPADCDSWGGVLGSGRAGTLGGTGSNWTGGCEAIQCAEDGRLYCFQK